MRCCIASLTTSTLKDQHNFARTPVASSVSPPASRPAKITSL
jgi:hypothetical protein